MAARMDENIQPIASPRSLEDLRQRRLGSQAVLAMQLHDCRGYLGVIQNALALLSQPSADNLQDIPVNLTKVENNITCLCKEFNSLEAAIKRKISGINSPRDTKESENPSAVQRCQTLHRSFYEIKNKAKVEIRTLCQRIQNQIGEMLEVEPLKIISAQCGLLQNALLMTPRAATQGFPVQLNPHPFNFFRELKQLQHNFPTVTFDCKYLNALYLFGDSHLFFFSVLQNLINNAVQYGIDVNVKLVITPATDEQVNVTVEVENEGVGIKPEVAEDIFTRGYRSPAAQEKRTGGCGYGLANARDYAQAMGGDVVVSSYKDPTCFIVSDINFTTTTAEAVAAYQEQLKVIRTQLSILIVDDDPVSSILLKKILERQYHCQIDVATSGEQAASMVQPNKYILVITDWEMPGMNGVALIREIRKTDKNSAIILLTGHPQADFDQKNFSQATRYLQKPYKKEALYQLIDQICQLPSKSADKLTASTYQQIDSVLSSNTSSVTPSVDSGSGCHSSADTSAQGDTATTTVSLASGTQTTVGSPPYSERRDSGEDDPADITNAGNLGRRQ